MTEHGINKGRRIFREIHTPEGRKERREAHSAEATPKLQAGRDLYAQMHPTRSAADSKAGLRAGTDRYNAQKGTNGG